MAEFGSKLDNDLLSLVASVGQVDEWRPSSLVLVQAAWACDREIHSPTAPRAPVLDVR